MSDDNEDAVRRALDAASKSAPYSNRKWPKPDRILVSAQRPPVPRLCSEKLQYIFGSCAALIRDAADTKCCPVEYSAVSLLAVAAALIGNARWACVWPEWEEACVLWVMLIGDPSSSKSPAMDAVLQPISVIDAEFSKEYKKELDVWEEQSEVVKAAYAVWKQEAKAAIETGGSPPPQPKESKSLDPPVQRRIRTDDATTEVIAAILEKSWRGILQHRDELTGWLNSMDRYGGGGDREFWLEAFGGRAFTVDRKSSPKPLTVRHLSVSILGSTQPEKLDEQFVKSADDGLLSRFLVVFPDRVPLKRPTQEFDRSKLLAVMRRLLALEPDYREDGSPTPRLINFDDDAQDTLQAFREDCQAWEVEAEGKMKSHIGKLPGLAVRVALVLSLLDSAAADLPAAEEAITADHVKRATLLVGHITKAHMSRALAASSIPKERLAANKVAEVIRRERLTTISTREIQRRGMSGLGTASEIHPAMEVLLAADWITPKPQNSKGRPNRQFLVNPRVHEEEEKE